MRNWLFGNNINTDLVTPGRYNITTDAEELANIAFIEYRPEFAKAVKKGDFLIAGTNFGCGSSRETAAIALKHCGLHAIIACSFARIFYRNCLNQGLLTIVADTSDIEQSDVLRLDTNARKLHNITKKWTRSIDIPEFVLVLHKYGGIVPFIAKHGLGALATLKNLASK